MNGAGHYQAAERLVKEAHAVLGEGADDHHPDTFQMVANTIAAAQVHATLALAAATAHGTCGISPQAKSSAEFWDAVTTLPTEDPR